TDAIVAYNKHSSPDLNVEPKNATGEDGPRHGQFALRLPRDGNWDSTKPFYSEWEVSLPGEVTSAFLWCVVTDSQGVRLIQERFSYNQVLREQEQLTWRIGVCLPALWLKPGLYTV